MHNSHRAIATDEGYTCTVCANCTCHTPEAAAAQCIPTGYYPIAQFLKTPDAKQGASR